MGIDWMHFGVFLVVPSKDDEGREESDNKVKNASGHGKSSGMF